MDRGKIPPYVASNQIAMNQLPIFFRTISGNKPTAEELDQLAKYLKSEL
jgi:hypothetical protein